jgi:DNA repair protein RecN (Recombination protein N)
MMKVASGGELSRFLLALKVALADRGSAPTLVFDEIDTGVGGAVADAIGQRLARLAAACRCFRSRMRRRSRRAPGARITSSRSRAAPTACRPASRRCRRERVEEIARMLAGATITDEARAAARRLIEESAR